MSVRHAALKLHGLSEVDQQWMLERLPAERRAELEPLLAELRELGMPRGTEVPVSKNPFARLRSAPAPALTDAERLAQLPSATIVAALQGETTAVVSKLISCGEWPWRDDVALAFAVAAPSAVPEAAPRLLAHFTHQLLQRVKALEQLPAMTSDTRPYPAPAGSNAVTRWFKRSSNTP